ncbi:MAG: hypothetical protein E7279_07015 [Lachnospiraceae bacterium]|nr:hypothetical protein [Lachnospiraceae bacterium]
MDNIFPKTEKLYRAIYPPKVSAMYWRKDGTISSAAFADSQGLSVERGDFRSDNVVVNSMLERFTGYIVSLYARDCFNVGAILRYLPSNNSVYHSEIHGSESKKLLSKSQRYYLAKKARIVNK